MIDFSPEAPPPPKDVVSPPGRTQTVFDRARNKIPKAARALKISAAAATGLLSLGGPPTYTDPVLYPKIPGIEPIPIVNKVEQGFGGRDGCYQVIEDALTRLPNKVPVDRAQLLCIDRKDIDVKAARGADMDSHGLVGPDFVDTQIRLPDDLLRVLKKEIEPIIRLSPSPDKVASFDFNYYHGVNSSTANNPENPFMIFYATANEDKYAVEMGLYPGIPISEVSLMMAASHEAFHLAEDSSVMDDDTFVEIWMKMATRRHDNFRQFESYRDDLPEYLRERYKSGGPNTEMPALGSLLTLVDESSYANGEGGGHPFSNPRETFASTGMVLRYFPESFMASVNKLPASDKQLMQELAQHVVLFFNGGAKKPDFDRLGELFEPQLLNWLFPIPVDSEQIPQ